MESMQYSTALISKMQKIADRADYKYSDDKCTDLNGITFSFECSGSGPYHEETRLLLGEKGGKYFFMEDDTAPMAGHFRWVILSVSKSEIKTQEEMNYLKKLLIEKRSKEYS